MQPTHAPNDEVYFFNSKNKISNVKMRSAILKARKTKKCPNDSFQNTKL